MYARRKSLSKMCIDSITLIQEADQYERDFSHVVRATDLSRSILERLGATYLVILN